MQRALNLAPADRHASESLDGLFVEEVAPAPAPDCGRLRKGAMPARLGESGILPGSMGTLSFHVEGRVHEEALCSNAHGAGRAFSRTAARHHVTERDLRRQMEGVWYDSRLAA